MLLRLFDGRLHVVDVTDRVDEKVILPVDLLAGALLEIGQVDPVLLEDVENLRQRAGLVRGGEHDRRLVVSALACPLAADDEETRDVIGIVLDVLEEDVQVVDFAGPYFLAKQDIMVKKDDNSIKSVTDLNGKKVCTVKGSTSEKNVRAKAPTADIVLFDTYSQCAEALTDGRVVAETTDNTVLAGLVQASNGAFKLVGAPFSDEPYGIGLKKGDQPFRDFLNNRLQAIEKSGQWNTAFRDTLGKLGLPTPQPPAIDRYPGRQQHPPDRDRPASEPQS